MVFNGRASGKFMHSVHKEREGDFVTHVPSEGDCCRGAPLQRTYLSFQNDQILGRGPESQRQDGGVAGTVRGDEIEAHFH